MKRYISKFAESDDLKAPYKISGLKKIGNKEPELDFIDEGSAVITKIKATASDGSIVIEVKQGQTIALLSFDDKKEAQEEGWLK